MRQRRRLIDLSAAGVATVLSIGVSSAVLSGIVSSAGSTAPEAVLGRPPVLPPGSVRIGALAPSTPLALRIVLMPRDPAALANFVTAVSTPGQSSYRHYVASAQFGPSFGPSISRLDSIVGTLRKLGLRPGRVAPDRLVIPVATTVRTAERAFRLQISRYRLASGQIVFANTSPPRLPAAVAGSVEAVVGLDDLVREEPVGAGTRAGPSTTTAIAARERPSTTGPKPCSSAISVGAATASTLASAYGLESLYSAGDLGKGETIALFESAAFSANDVSVYQKCYGTSTSVTTIPVDGGAPVGSGTLEATSDVEDVIGLAPKASIRVYETPNVLEPDYIDDWTRIVDDDAAQVVSTSWLTCEGNEPTGYLAAENTLLEQAAAQGQTVVADAGDYGSEGCDQFTGSTSLSVDDTASQPYVTGVGGTQWPGLSRSGETTWNDSEGAGGGGISSVWRKPSWQRGPGVINRYSSGEPCGAKAGDCREVPDVSALAGAPFYTFYCTAGDCSSIGGWGSFYGTSFATPLWASLVALSDENCGAAPPAGFLNPALYRLAASKHSPFHDITTGENDFTGTNGGDYPATKGYDLATGLGTPIVTTGSSRPGLASDLCRLATPTSITLTSSVEKVRTSRAKALYLQVSESTLFGSSPATSASVTLSTAGAPTGSGLGEWHTWLFPLPSAALSERGGAATVSTGSALGTYGGLTLSFKDTTSRAMRCTAGSGTIYGGKLSGRVDFATNTGSHGWGGVDSRSFSFSGSNVLSVDYGCVAPSPGPRACFSSTSFELAQANPAWSGSSAGRRSAVIVVERRAGLSSPKGATRLDALSAKAAVFKVTSRGGTSSLSITPDSGQPITGEATIAATSSSTTHGPCDVGGSAGHHEITTVYSGRSPSSTRHSLKATFQISRPATAPTSISAHFTLYKYH
jgi:hypothetical protein